jgi:hypothetical protein
MIAYMFDPDYTVTGRHYAHPLVSWPTIIAGAIAAVALGVLLNVLGVAIGATTFNPFEMRHEPAAISAGGVIYVIFSQFVALQVGGFIASRAARYPDHFGGLMNGFLVWALAVLVAVTLATWLSGATASGSAVSAGVAETASDVRNAVTPDASVDSLQTTSDAADLVARLAWCAAAAIGSGLAGAIAGGWLGAVHPSWETRPRVDDRAAYQTAPEL